MKFQIIENINIRNDIIKYFSDTVEFTNYYIYIGIINNYFGVILSINKLEEEKIEINNITKFKYNNKNRNMYLLNKTLTNVSKNIDKYIELYTNDYYVKFPISNDTIEWLNSSIEIINETPEIYNNISLPYINSIYNKNIKWINNLLHNKSEEERILIRNDNFVICKDILWKDNNINNLYILAIPLKNIKSIRDLTNEDIPLLENIKINMITILNSYNVELNDIIMFFHYHPSYYHLHLHVCFKNSKHIDYNRQFYIDDIIEKLKENSNYWKESDLTFEMITTSKLYKLLKLLK